MHATSEELQDLAEAYVKEEILSDGQLTVKKHMAGCDACYQSFCAKYVLLSSLNAYKLIPLDVGEEEELQGLQEPQRLQELQESQRLQELQESQESQESQRLQELQESQESQRLQELQESQRLRELQESQRLRELQESQRLQELQEVQGLQEETAPGLGAGLQSGAFLALKKIGEAFILLKQQGESLAGCWEFFERPQLAMARGESSAEKETVYVSRQSEESVILCGKDRVSIQLEEEIFAGGELKLQVISDGEEKIFSFSYEEDLGCYEAVLDAAEWREGTVIQIIKV